MANTEENIEVIEGTVGISIPNEGQDYSETMKNTLSNLNEAKKYCNSDSNVLQWNLSDNEFIYFSY